MATTQNQQIASIMNHFGFSEPEVDIYLAVLTLEKATVSQIARVTKRGRTAIYFHVGRLIERGVLAESRHKKKLSLVATPPDELGKRFDAWSTDFRSLVPTLLSMKKIAGETPTIRITDSRQGYYEVYEEISSLPEKALFRVLEGRVAMENELSLLTKEQWQKFFTRIAERGIITKGIFTEEAKNIADKKLSADLRALAQKRTWHTRMVTESALPFHDMLFIYGSKIAFLFPETSLVLTIAHPGIAAALTVMFDGLYGSGKPEAIV